VRHLVQQGLVDAVHALHDLHLVDELADRPSRQEIREGVLAAGLVGLGEACLEPRLRRLEVGLRARSDWRFSRSAFRVFTNF
jgi:hypothetical protein